MTLPVQTFDTPDQAGTAVADRIMALFEQSDCSRPFLLGCPGGRSPRPVYSALANRFRDLDADASRLVVVMMDEYLIVQPDGSFHLPDPGEHFSCRGFAEREIRQQINSGLDSDHRIPIDNLWMPDQADPPAYDRRIRDAGGIDFFILASGAGDGHVAFNPPGSPAASRTRIVRLAEQTRRDNLQTFPDFANVDAVPSHGLTVGIGTITDLSSEIGVIVWGKDKRDAFRRIASAHRYDPQWPATVGASCRTGVLYADWQAAQCQIASRSVK